MLQRYGSNFENHIIQNPVIFVWISNNFLKNGSQLSGFQMVGFLDFRNLDFSNGPTFDHLKSPLNDYNFFVVPIQCVECGKSFPKACFLTKHMEMYHDKDKEHACPGEQLKKVS